MYLITNGPEGPFREFAMLDFAEASACHLLLRVRRVLTLTASRSWSVDLVDLHLHRYTKRLRVNVDNLKIRLMEFVST